MANSEVHSPGWISVNVGKEHEYTAKKIRAERDERYGNIYLEKQSDERWVGDLGEIAFKSWLKNRGVIDFKWITNDAAGEPDFIITPNIRVGVKTVKRKVPPRSGYTAQITAKHASEPTDYFFFMTYEISQKKMWLLGAITHELFMSEARYYSAGEWVHPNYQIRHGHEIFNIEIEKLIPPDRWLSEIL
jgi:hypothetical protein